MSLPIALVVAAALLAATVLVGVLLRRRDGRAVPVHGDHQVDPADLLRPLGAHATLVQFSTEFCARCPQVRRMLGGIAAEHPGVAHAEVDLTARADLAARYKVLSTPTVLVVDPDGRIRSRFTGVPARADLLTALDAARPLEARS
ncbi:MAG: thioredoxin family protein [Actinobacteria bacterium]|nr:thioredoxin family protein [Actinomycetota bacterium]